MFDDTEPTGLNMDMPKYQVNVISMTQIPSECN